ncbi:MAG: ankyrin repeat domain-containing protein [Planctomycetota bacterium]
MRINSCIGSAGMLVLLPLVGCHSLLLEKTPSNLIRSGRGGAAVRLLESGDFASSRESLFEAAIYNQPKVVSWILENGFDVDTPDSDGRTVLWMCSTAEVMSEVLRHNPSLDREVDGKTALRSYLYGNSWPPSGLEEENQKKAELLLKSGASLDLISAILLHRNEFAIEYLKKHAPSAHKFEGRVPLRLAAISGNVELCRFLIEDCKFDVDDFEGGNGYPVMTDALEYPRIVKLLIDYGADLNRRITCQGGRSGFWIVDGNETCLHFAARKGTPETAKLLMDAGVDIFARADDLNGEPTITALELAAIHGETKTAVAIMNHAKFVNGDRSLRQQSLNAALEAASRRASRRGWTDEIVQARQLRKLLIQKGAENSPTPDK